MRELVALVPRMRRFAMSLTGSASEADDVVQGAMERAIRHISSWQRGTRLDSWLYRIVQNQFLNSVREEQVRTRLGTSVGQFTEPAVDPRHEIEVRLTLDSVKGEMQALDQDQRMVLVLVCVEGQSYAQVAETLGIPVGTVTSRLGRARAHLRRALYGHDEARSPNDGGNVGI